MDGWRTSKWHPLCVLLILPPLPVYPFPSHLEVPMPALHSRYPITPLSAARVAAASCPPRSTRCLTFPVLKALPSLISNEWHQMAPEALGSSQPVDGASPEHSLVFIPPLLTEIVSLTPLSSQLGIQGLPRSQMRQFPATPCSLWIEPPLIPWIPVSPVFFTPMRPSALGSDESLPNMLILGLCLYWYTE